MAALKNLQKLATSHKATIINKKVHLVLKFDQSKRLKAYIEFNTKKKIRTGENGKKKKKKNRKTFSQINKQCGTWESNGKLEKPS